MQVIFFSSKLYAYVHSKEWKNGKSRQKKNRDEHQSQKNAEADLTDSDGRKAGHFADAYE